ncbi:hypothetical protein CRYUN_Cryun34aG0066900 [Craigia yunnanensis]
MRNIDNSFVGFFLFFALLVNHAIVELEGSHHVYKNFQTVRSTYRTGYHFQPPRNWINRPLVYKRLYHLFYQYNPKGEVWGNIVWAHSTSKDLVNGTPHDPAIYPSQPSDINGCWSGSATILPGGKPAILYTGIDPKDSQVQNLVVPKNLSDPYLREWIKSPKNPLMQPTAQNQINATSFRDPSTAWFGPDKKWRVIMGSQINRQGLAILYKSKDFVNWVQAQTPLHSAKDNGMWECPDFFPVSVSGKNGIDTSLNGHPIKHVLKTPDKGSVESDSGLRYDYGKFYASKSFLDSVKNRRILWGWINELSSVEDNIKKGWAGVEAIPRKLWLSKSGKQLVQWPIVEIKKLRANYVRLPSKLLKGGSVIEVSGVTAAQADIDISFKITDFAKAEVLKPSWTNPQLLCSQKGASVKGSLGPFGLLVLASKGLKENTAVFFRIFKGQNKYVVLISSLNKDDDKTTYGAFLDVNPLHQKLSLRSLTVLRNQAIFKAKGLEAWMEGRNFQEKEVDHSIVESFGGGGKACITARVYPTLATNNAAHLYVFNNGSMAVKIAKLNARSMKTAKINRN